MNLVSLMLRFPDLPVYVGELALRALLVACVIALLTALIPRKRAVVRLYVWTGVLYVALAMPLLGAFLPHIKLPVPASWRIAVPTAPPTAPSPNPSTSAKPVLNSIQSSALPESQSAPPTLQHRSKQASISPAQPVSEPRNQLTTAAATSQQSFLGILAHINWKPITAGIYFFGVFVLLLRLLLGIRGSRRLATSAEFISARYFLRKDEVEDARNSAALDFLSSCAHRAGLKTLPSLKESAALSVPATVGLRRPVILLPTDWRTWTQSKIEAVLAHEISHVSRHDALTQFLALLHRAVFWFSPLSWWLNRHLAELAEQASDEAALAGGADRTLYAETLLGFFAQLETTPGRIRWQALCMANRESSASAERRVDRILAWKGTAVTRKSLIIALIALAVPITLLVASLHPFVAHAQPKSQPQELAPSQPAVSAEPTTAPAAQAPAKPSAAVSSPVVQETPAAPQPEAEQREERQSNTETFNHRSGYFYGYGFGPRYVILTGNAKNVSMSGNNEDLQHALALHKKMNGDLIWFERDEKSYIITDPTFIGKARALFAPQEELGKKQEELGRQQEELGRQQDALGQQMEKVSVKVPDITAELERISARLKELQASGATQSELGNVQRQLGELQGQIGRLQSTAGRGQSAIGRQQGELGRKQGELGRQQGQLGRQQAELARQASRELNVMFDDAISKGIAKPE
jgi:beta-lactamase regulating signal transducer with metallopeptidase domain